jgi:hypothetical protein
LDTKADIWEYKSTLLPIQSTLNCNLHAAAIPRFRSRSAPLPIRDLGRSNPLPLQRACRLRHNGRFMDITARIHPQRTGASPPTPRQRRYDLEHISKWRTTPPSFSTAEAAHPPRPIFAMHSRIPSSRNFVCSSRPRKAILSTPNGCPAYTEPTHGM